MSLHFIDQLKPYSFLTLRKRDQPRIFGSQGPAIPAPAFSAPQIMRKVMKKPARKTASSPAIITHRRQVATKVTKAVPVPRSHIRHSHIAASTKRAPARPTRMLSNTERKQGWELPSKKHVAATTTILPSEEYPVSNKYGILGSLTCSQRKEIDRTGTLTLKKNVHYSRNLQMQHKRRKLLDQEAEEPHSLIHIFFLIRGT